MTMAGTTSAYGGRKDPGSPYMAGGRMGHFSLPTRTALTPAAAPLAKRDPVTRASTFGSRRLGLTTEDRHAQLLGFGMARRRGASFELLG